MRVEEGGEYSIPGAHPVWEQVPALEPLGVCVYYFFFTFMATLGLHCGARAFSLWCTRFSLQWFLSLWSSGSRRVGSGVSVRGL